MFVYRSNGQFRNTLHKARTFCDKLRAHNMRLGSSSTLGSNGISSNGGGGGGGAGAPNPAAAAAAQDALDGTIQQQGQNRLARWFSMRRGSSHQYDVDSSSDSASLTSPVKAAQMAQLCEVRILGLRTVRPFDGMRVLFF